MLGVLLGPFLYWIGATFLRRIVDKVFRALELEYAEAVGWI